MAVFKGPHSVRHLSKFAWPPDCHGVGAQGQSRTYFRTLPNGHLKCNVAASQLPGSSLCCVRTAHKWVPEISQSSESSWAGLHCKLGHPKKTLKARWYPFSSVLICDAKGMTRAGCPFCLTSCGICPTNFEDPKQNASWVAFFLRNIFSRCLSTSCNSVYSSPITRQR